MRRQTDRLKQLALSFRIQFLGEGTQGCPRQMATRIERRATLAADPNHRYQHVRVVAVGVRAGFSLRFVISHGGYSCHPSRPHIHPSISANSRSGSCGHRLSCYTWTAWGCVASSSWRRCHWCCCHRRDRHTPLEMEEANGNWAVGLRPTTSLEAEASFAATIELSATSSTRPRPVELKQEETRRRE